jgi:PAS domain S-box-containing protein
MQPASDDPRLHWLLKTVQAVEDLLEEKIENSGSADADARPQAVQELKISLEELRVVGEELRRQSDEIALERQRYADLFNYAPDPYVMTDLDGVVRDANHAAARLFRCSQDSLSGKPLAIFLETDDRREFRRQLLFMASGMEPRTTPWNVTVTPREAGPVTVRLTVNVVPAPKGRPKSLCWLIRQTES